MAKPKPKGIKKTLRAKSARRSSVSDGGTRLHVPNSGLEVWLYDFANREMIRGVPVSGSGGMPPALKAKKEAQNDGRPGRSGTQ